MRAYFYTIGFASFAGFSENYRDGKSVLSTQD